MRRIQACINLDVENKEYLSSIDGSASEFINRLVKRYRESEEVQKAIGNIDQGDQKEIMEAAVKMTKREQAETELKIRAYFLDHPAIVYGIIKGPPPTSKQYQKLKDRMEWDKYRIKTDCDTIKKVLFDVIDKFDTKEYEKNINRL